MSRPAVRAARRPAQAAAGAGTAFDRILCGYDGSKRSLAAVRQAARLRAPAGRMLCVTVSDNGLSPQPSDASQMLERLARRLGRPPWLQTRTVVGLPDRTLECLAAGLEATLLAVGAPRGGRIRSAVRWDVAGCLLHRVPSSVLVARPASACWPARVVVGVDGSEPAAGALELARGVADRLDVPLLPVAAGEAAARDAADVPGLELDLRPPVDALVATASPDDLLVVGSRGLAGLYVLGSVSMRVAHAARGSVLVVPAGGVREGPVPDGRPEATAAVLVGELMSTDVVSVFADRSLAEVAELALAHGAETLAVRDGSGTFLGLLTVDELLGVGVVYVPGTPVRWPHFLGRPVWSEVELAELFRAEGATPVGDLVRPAPATVREDDPAFRAAELLARHHVPSLPVLCGSRLVGTISRADLLRLAAGSAAPSPRRR